MLVLRFIPDQIRCNDYQDLNACIGFVDSNEFDGFRRYGLIIGGSHGDTGFMIIVLVVKEFVLSSVKESKFSVKSSIIWRYCYVLAEWYQSSFLFFVLAFSNCLNLLAFL